MGKVESSGKNGGKESVSNESAENENNNTQKDQDEMVRTLQSSLKVDAKGSDIKAKAETADKSSANTQEESKVTDGVEIKEYSGTWDVTFEPDSSSATESGETTESGEATEGAVQITSKDFYVEFYEENGSYEVDGKEYLEDTTFETDAGTFSVHAPEPALTEGVEDESEETSNDLGSTESGGDETEFAIAEDGTTNLDTLGDESGPPAPGISYFGFDPTVEDAKNMLAEAESKGVFDNPDLFEIKVNYKIAAGQDPASAVYTTALEMCAVTDGMNWYQFESKVAEYRDPSGDGTEKMSMAEATRLAVSDQLGATNSFYYYSENDSSNVTAENTNSMDDDTLTGGAGEAGDYDQYVINYINEDGFELNQDNNEKINALNMSKQESEFFISRYDSISDGDEPVSNAIQAVAVGRQRITHVNTLRNEKELADIEPAQEQEIRGMTDEQYAVFNSNFSDDPGTVGSFNAAVYMATGKVLDHKVDAAVTALSSATHADEEGFWSELIGHISTNDSPGTDWSRPESNGGPPSFTKPRAGTK